MAYLTRVGVALFSKGLAAEAKGVDGTATSKVAPATIDIEEAELECLGDAGQETTRGATVTFSLLFLPGLARTSLDAMSLGWDMENPAW